MVPWPQTREYQQKLEEEEKDSPLEPSRGVHSPVDILISAFRIVRQYISVVLGHFVCDNLLQQPQETNTDAKTSGERTMPQEFT